MVNLNGEDEFVIGGSGFPLGGLERRRGQPPVGEQVLERRSRPGRMPSTTTRRVSPR